MGIKCDRSCSPSEVKAKVLLLLSQLGDSFMGLVAFL